MGSLSLRALIDFNQLGVTLGAIRIGDNRGAPRHAAPSIKINYSVHGFSCVSMGGELLINLAPREN